MDEHRKKALAAALNQIEKQFGKGSVMRMGDTGAVRNVEAISTGSLGLDLALGLQAALARLRVVQEIADGAPGDGVERQGNQNRAEAFLDDHAAMFSALA